jgi:hypothetical protein
LIWRGRIHINWRLGLRRAVVRADDMVELYWMALCRDVNFTDYGTDASAQGAATELSSLAGFAGPKSGGSVTALNLFVFSLDSPLLRKFPSGGDLSG